MVNKNVLRGVFLCKNCSLVVISTSLASFCTYVRVKKSIFALDFENL